MDKAKAWTGPRNFAGFWCCHQETALSGCSSYYSPVRHAPVVMPVSLHLFDVFQWHAGCSLTHSLQSLTL